MRVEPFSTFDPAIKPAGFGHERRSDGEGPWVPADFDLRGFIEELRDAKGFEIEDMPRPIRETSDNELEQARQDALLFSGPPAMIGSVLEELLGA